MHAGRSFFFRVSIGRPDAAASAGGHRPRGQWEAAASAGGPKRHRSAAVALGGCAGQLAGTPSKDRPRREAGGRGQRRATARAVHAALDSGKLVITSNQLRYVFVIPRSGEFGVLTGWAAWVGAV